MHKKIHLGDTLLIIDHAAITKELNDNIIASTMISSYIEDLERLISDRNPHTIRYLKVQQEYLQNLTKALSDYNFREEEYASSKTLFNAGYMAKIDYENQKRNYLSAEANLKLAENEYKNRWENELSAYKLQLLQLHTGKAHILNNKAKYIITSPISGTICDYHELIPGTYIAANTPICRIIPMQDLQATVLIPSDKISRIKIGQQVKLNIDAYPGSSYGRLEASVAGIPEDASTYTNTHAYPITCSLLKQSLESSDTKIEKLSSGMTCTALFILCRKSLFQLIIEKGEKLLLQTDNLANDEAHP